MAFDSLKGAFEGKSFKERIGLFGAYIYGRAAQDTEAAYESLGYIGAGKRAAYDASVDAATGVRVTKGETLDRMPRQVDSSELVAAAEAKRAKNSFKRALTEGHALAAIDNRRAAHAKEEKKLAREEAKLRKSGAALTLAGG